MNRVTYNTMRHCARSEVQYGVDHDPDTTQIYELLCTEMLGSPLCPCLARPTDPIVPVDICKSQFDVCSALIADSAFQIPPRQLIPWARSQPLVAQLPQDGLVRECDT